MPSSKPGGDTAPPTRRQAAEPTAAPAEGPLEGPGPAPNTDIQALTYNTPSPAARGPSTRLHPLVSRDSLGPSRRTPAQDHCSPAACHGRTQPAHQQASTCPGTPESYLHPLPGKSSPGNPQAEPLPKAGQYHSETPWTFSQG